MSSVKVCVAGLDSRDNETRLERALCGLVSVYGAVANRQDACVVVEYEDDELAPDEILDVIRREGFSPELVG